MILSQLIQRLRFLCHRPGHLLQALISVQIVGMAQRKVNRETQRGGAMFSISRHSPLSERLKLVTSIREFKIPPQLQPVTGVHTPYPTPSLPPLPAHTSLRRPARRKSHLKMTLHSLKLQRLYYFNSPGVEFL